MKINGIKNKQIGGKSVKKKEGTASSISFVGLLEEQLGQIQEAAPTTVAEKILETPSASSSIRLTGLALSENTIDILAAFSEALENLDLSAESLRPLIDALEEETTAILDIKEQLEADDPLAELLDRIAAVAYLETEKYRRGDYEN